MPIDVFTHTQQEAFDLQLTHWFRGSEVLSKQNMVWWWCEGARAEEETKRKFPSHGDTMHEMQERHPVNTSIAVMRTQSMTLGRKTTAFVTSKAARDQQFAAWSRDRGVSSLSYRKAAVDIFRASFRNAWVGKVHLVEYFRLQLEGMTFKQLCINASQKRAEVCHWHVSHTNEHQHGTDSNSQVLQSRVASMNKAKPII